MLYRILGKSTLSPSVIGLGALHFGSLCEEKLALGVIHEAIDGGINFVDTAPMYGNGNSERIVGHAISGKRSKVILASKVGLQPITNANGSFGVKTVPLTRATIRETTENSLRALGTDYLDLIQLHAFDDTVPIEETLYELTELVRDGKVRYIGCSNYNEQQLTQAVNAIVANKFVPFTSIQSHYNILERRLEADVLPICKTHQIGVMCYRALNRGILNNKYQLNAPPPKDSRGAISERVRSKAGPDTLKLVSSLDVFSKLRGYTVGDLSLAWLVAQPQVSVMILGMRSSEQVKQNLSAIEWRLSSDDIEAIDQIILNKNLMGKVLSEPDVFLET